MLEIRDDGRGFDRSAVDIGGQGLNNMKLRAAAIGGRFELATAPGAGTVIRVSVDHLES